MNSFHPGKGRLRSHSIFDIIFFGLQLNIFHSHYISFSFFAFSQISVLIFNKAVMNFGRKSYRFVYSHILSLAFRFRLSYRVFNHVNFTWARLSLPVFARRLFFFFFLSSADSRDESYSGAEWKRFIYLKLSGFFFKWSPVNEMYTG